MDTHRKTTRSPQILDRFRPGKPEIHRNPGAAPDSTENWAKIARKWAKIAGKLACVRSHFCLRLSVSHALSPGGGATRPVHASRSLALV